MKKILLTIAVALGVLLSSMGASAWYRHGYVYVGPGYYGGPYYHSYYRGCRWVPGHYDYYGYWVPGRRVCW